MVFCERHPDEGCEGCNSINLCEINEGEKWTLIKYTKGMH